MQRTVFDRIIDGEIKAHRVYENDLFLAFLDAFPRSEGHTLVIPKKQYRWVYDVPEFDLYWETVHIVTKGIQKALKPEWISYMTFGLEIPHAHVHILPRFTPETVMVESWPHPLEEQPDFKEIAAKIRKELE